VRLSSAYRCVSYEPTSSRSPARTGDDFTSPAVVNVHSRLPSRTLTAWIVPPRSPKNTALRLAVGDDSPVIAPDAYFQRSLPDARSRARRSPLADVAYTTASTIAGEDSMASAAA
jgi:hypothetical protein